MIVSNLPSKRIEEYRAIIGSEVDKILEIGKSLKEYSVTHVNSTSFGGGVAELLYSIVPLMNNVGLKATWE
ncbi:MAG: glycosyl transferase family 1, partial [Thermoproteota archaeon]